MEKQINGLLQDLDFNAGNLLLNKENLDAIKFGLSRIRNSAEKVKDEDMATMGLVLREVYQNIVMVDELLRYTLKDYDENIENIDGISNDFHEINFNKENTCNEKGSL